MVTYTWDGLQLKDAGFIVGNKQVLRVFSSGWFSDHLGEIVVIEYIDKRHCNVRVVTAWFKTVRLPVLSRQVHITSNPYM